MVGRTVVTISRQLGCGGAEVGRLIAAGLGLRYADREILHMAAEALGVEASDIAWREERPSSLWERVARVFEIGTPEVPYIPPPIRPIPNEELFVLEGQIIRQLAAREDCVIVGRGAAYVLREHPGATRVLLHAPLAFRLRRVMEVYHAGTEERANAMIRQSDGERHVLMERVGHTDWLRAEHYHLSLDASTIPLEQAADMIVRYVRLRFPQAPAGRVS